MKTEKTVKQKSKKNNSKIRIFYIILFLIPILFIVFLEAFLKIISYGGDLDLFITKEINGKSYQFINKTYGKRYFSNRSFYPLTSDDYFETKKSSNTFRIFCFGESTTLGYPYMYAISFPSLLKDRLSKEHPEKKIEVVNLGMTAITSICIKDMLIKSLNYEPDLIIIYAGHNEFYGAFGVASVEGSINNFLTNYSLKLRKFRIFWLLEDLFQSLFEIIGAKKDDSQQSLMEALAKERSIPIHGELYYKCLNLFKENLSDIFVSSAKKGIPVIISSLISNTKDQAPFISIYSNDLTAEKRSEFNLHFDLGINLLSKNNFEGSISELKKVIAIDSQPAKVHYLLAKSYEKSGRIGLAKEEYLKAKDYDGLRFRASEEFNEAIKLLSYQHKVFFVDMSDSVSAYSENRIIGREYILEHLHPNFEGYFLISKILSNFIHKNGILNKGENEFSDGALKTYSGYNIMDSIAADYRIKILRSRWPFKEKNEKFILKPESEPEKIVCKFVNSEINWEQMQVSAAEYFKRESDLWNASRSYLALIKITPYNPAPYKFLGEILIEIGNLYFAEEIYSKLSEIEASAEVFDKLGAVCIELHKTQDAIKYLNSAAYLDKIKKNSDILYRKYILGLAYLQLEDYSKAKVEFDYVYNIDPHYQKIKDIIIFLENKK